MKTLRHCLLLLMLGAVSSAAFAVPIYARQTNQACAACHAGGQFPELTAYGRQFKLLGYTLGERSVPLAVAGVLSEAKVRSSQSAMPGDLDKNGALIFSQASLYAGGKLTDNLGLFSQATYDNYAAGHSGHTAVNMFDLRWAKQFDRLITGVSLNNQPSLADPWNTAPAWMQYVPNASVGSARFTDATAPYPSYGVGMNVAGLSAYALWNNALYGEIGSYRTANGAFSFLGAGVPNAMTTRLSGNNPYWRLAYSLDAGAHSLMFGASGMIARVYDMDSTPDADHLGKSQSAGVDAQYQYVAAVHTVTAQLTWQRLKQTYSASQLMNCPQFFQADGMTPIGDCLDTSVFKTVRGKLTYVYQARYGGSLGAFARSGASNPLNQTVGYDMNGMLTTGGGMGGMMMGNSASPGLADSLSSDPGVRGYTGEVFYTPEQHLRVGLQYTGYNEYNGARNNYNGAGRNAADNNTLLLYVWGAY